MILIAIYGLRGFILVGILGLVSFLISENVLIQREELSAYECGFEHVSYSRVPFSFRYFFLTLIFLIFDIEVVFLLFLPSRHYLISNPSVAYLYAFLFVLVLTGRLIYEWSDGRLDWVI